MSPSVTNTVMTMVTDEKFSNFIKFICDIIGRVLKGSLDPDAVMNAIRTLIGQGKFSLPSLNREYKFSDLINRPDIYSFFGTISDFGIVKPSGKTLTMPYPKPLGEVTTERSMLHKHPKLKGLSDKELLKEAVKIFPQAEVLLGAMVNAMIESEEGRESLIPTAVGTWTLGFCVQNGELQILVCRRRSGGWGVGCGPVKLGREWSAEFLLLLATDSSKL